MDYVTALNKEDVAAGLIYNLVFFSLDVLCPVFCITKRKWIYFSMENNPFFLQLRLKIKR